VILLQDVIEVLHRSMSAVLLQSTFGFELRNRRRITGVLVGVVDPRRRMLRSAHGFGEEALSRSSSNSSTPRYDSEKRKVYTAFYKF
jgi:hypothetical protein